MKQPKRVLITALEELALVAVLLLCFAFFHHVLPGMRAVPTPVAAIPVSTPSPVPTQAPAAEAEAPADEGSEAAEVPAVELTEWQQRFADHFTDEIVRTDTSYSSPEVAITVDTLTYGDDARTTYYLADIYVARIENFQTCLANDSYALYSKQDALEMAANHNALLAVNGDFYSYQGGGIVLRNGTLYNHDPYCVRYYDICVLYKNGVMATYAPGEYVMEDVLAADPWQIWQFGPELLFEDGSPDVATVNTTSVVEQINPRTAIGYYEPGHYCLLVADGRQEGYSKGLRFNELAQIFSDLGCKAAYNLDGGGSSCMIFNNQLANRQSNGEREISDLLLIAELG